MSSQAILRTVEFKIYPTKTQAATLERWLRTCAWLYNQMLEHRVKVYKRRKECATYVRQCALLTRMRERIPSLRDVPAQFERDALRRLDRAMKAFFRRCQSGEKPGFPRFRSLRRYKAIECLVTYDYLRRGNRLLIPKLGMVKCRLGKQQVPSTQKAVRIIRRASGWYAHLVVEEPRQTPPVTEPLNAIGIDMGLSSFATLSNGERIENPRIFRRSELKLRRANRQLSRKKVGSRNHRKTRRRVARIWERIREQRRDFAHQESRRLVNRFNLLGFEKLNIRGLAQTRYARHILDAAWGMFLTFVMYKAAWAGRRAIGVESRGTSQECPGCGAIRKKKIFERVHLCPCGAFLDRDHAAALVIHARALRAVGATACGGNGQAGRSRKRSDVNRADETGRLNNTLV